MCVCNNIKLFFSLHSVSPENVSSGSGTVWSPYLSNIVETGEGIITATNDLIITTIIIAVLIVNIISCSTCDVAGNFQALQCFYRIHNPRTEVREENISKRFMENISINQQAPL